MSLGFILSIALLLRAPMFLTEPSLSDDVWRYIHDGRAQNAGVNPYRFAPAHRQTASFRGPEYSRINHPELPTIYPPVAQYTFRFAALFPDPLLAWRLLLLACELGLVWAAATFLARRRINTANLMLYAWHPLAIVESIGSAHLEPVAIALMVGALAFMTSGRPLRAGAALAAAVAAKLVAAPVLLSAGRGWRTPAAFLLTLVAVYAPFASDGTNALGSLGVFANSWESNGSFFTILAPIVGERIYRLVAATLLLSMIWLWRRRPVADATLYYFLALFILAPVVHPWYLLWVLAAAVLRDDPLDVVGRAAFVWTITVPFAYFAHTQQVWQVPDTVLIAEYLPVLMLLGYSLVTFSKTYFKPSIMKTAAKT